MTKIPTYQRQQIDALLAVAEALTTDLFAPLLIKSPPPVRLVENKGHIGWGGWCPPEDIAEFQEVTVINYSGPGSHTKFETPFGLPIYMKQRIFCCKNGLTKKSAATMARFFSP